MDRADPPHLEVVRHPEGQDEEKQNLERVRGRVRVSWGLSKDRSWWGNVEVDEGTSAFSFFFKGPQREPRVVRP